MDDFAVLITCLAMGLLLQWPASRICYRNPALVPWRGLIAVGALVWAGMVFLKIFFLDSIFPPVDGEYHETIARRIADHLSRGDMASAMEYFGYGNRGYRLLLGTFYAFTGAPEVVTYAINASLAFLGMVSLLEILCRQTGCMRVPLWLILITVFLPSVLYWTPNNLKEGLCFWGICMMLRATLRDPWTGAREIFLPLLGFAAVAFQRPHMAMAFAAAVGLGPMIHEKKIRHAFIITIAVISGFQVLQFIRPEFFNEMMQDGVMDALEASHQKREGLGSSAIYHPGGRPIPVITGLTLIFLRPFPHEISGTTSAMAALEVWLITMICAIGWMRLPGRRQALLHPFTVTLLAATLLMAFFFSYTYNMGLLVRQRLHVMPAVIALAAIPHLLSRNYLPAVDVSVSLPDCWPDDHYAEAQ